METAGDLGGKRAKPESVVGLVAVDSQVDAHLVELHELGPALDLSAAGLRRIRQVEAVDAAVE